MSVFQKGPSMETMDWISLAQRMIEADREMVFPWDQYLDSLMQTCLFRLALKTDSFIVSDSDDQ